MMLHDTNQGQTPSFEMSSSVTQKDCCSHKNKIWISSSKASLSFCNMCTAFSGHHFRLCRFNTVRKFRLQSWTQSSPAHCIKWIRRSLLSALRELELRITAGKLCSCNDLLYCWVLNWIIHLPSGRQKKKKRNHHINQVNKTPVTQYRGKGCRVTLGSPTLLWYFTPSCFHSSPLLLYLWAIFHQPVHSSSHQTLTYNH